MDWWTWDTGSFSAGLERKDWPTGGRYCVNSEGAQGQFILPGGETESQRGVVACLGAQQGLGPKLSDS